MAASKGQALQSDERTPQPHPVFRVRYLALLDMRLPPEALEAHQAQRGLKYATANEAVPNINLMRQ